MAKNTKRARGKSGKSVSKKSNDAGHHVTITGAESKFAVRERDSLTGRYSDAGKAFKGLAASAYPGDRIPGPLKTKPRGAEPKKK